MDAHVKIPTEFFDHCQNFYETFEVPAGCFTLNLPLASVMCTLYIVKPY